MLKHCATFSSLLILVSLATKLAVENKDTSTTSVATKLLEKSLHWRHVAMGETNIYNRYQHYVVALTFVHAAREVTGDVTLERITGIDTMTLLRSMEKSVTKARQNIERQKQ